MTKIINNMKIVNSTGKRMYNTSAMLSILKVITTRGIDAIISCGLIELYDFIRPRKQFEDWFIAKDELDKYKAYNGYNETENARTHFEEALSGYYFYSYDEPIEGLCPTYTIKINRLSGNVTIYVYYLG